MKNNINIKKKKVILILIVIFELLFAQQVFSKDTSGFTFPTFIGYKVIRNNRFVASTKYSYSKKGKGPVVLLTMSNIEIFGFNHKEKLVTYLNQNDLMFFSSFILRGQKIIQEVRLKKEKVIGLLNETVLIVKNSQESQPSITEFGTEYRFIDLLSSYFVISHKVANAKFETERFNLLIGTTTYLVDAIVDRNISVNYKGDKLCTTKVTLRYTFESHNKEKKEFVDLIEFYIYFDRKHKVWFPVKVKIDDLNMNSIQLIADKWL